jgi:hypothetical protein
MPISGMPYIAALRATDITAAFIPGLSPPLVNTPIFLMVRLFSFPFFLHQYSTFCKKKKVSRECMLFPFR